MKLSEYQIQSARTLKRDNELREQLLECSLALAGEVGALVDHIKKHAFHGHELDLDYLKKELGDIMWYTAAMATVNFESLDEIADINIDKLLKRYPTGFSEADSRNRVEYE